MNSDANIYPRSFRYGLSAKVQSLNTFNKTALKSIETMKLIEFTIFIVVLLNCYDYGKYNKRNLKCSDCKITVKREYFYESTCTLLLYFHCG